MLSINVVLLLGAGLLNYFSSLSLISTVELPQQPFPKPSRGRVPKISIVGLSISKSEVKDIDQATDDGLDRQEPTFHSY
ncbi:hypothetical protein PM082_008969 [Marasmius tenuissimus]|nr:hypothetical protein PM082_008969 [Marasmius tenuissimus]